MLAHRSCHQGERLAEEEQREDCREAALPWDLGGVDQGPDHRGVDAEGSRWGAVPAVDEPQQQAPDCQPDSLAPSSPRGYRVSACCGTRNARESRTSPRTPRRAARASTRSRALAPVEVATSGLMERMLRRGGAAPPGVADKWGGADPDTRESAGEPPPAEAAGAGACGSLMAGVRAECVSSPFGNFAPSRGGEKRPITTTALETQTGAWFFGLWTKGAHGVVRPRMPSAA